MALNATAQLPDPWVCWDETNCNSNRVKLVPAALWNMNRWSIISIQLNRWSGPFYPFIFFAFFGSAVETRGNYFNAISKVLMIASRLKHGSSPPQKTSPRSFALSRNSVIQSPQVDPWISLRDVSCAPVCTPPPLYYQPINGTTAPTSGGKGFAPLATAGTVPELTVSACENHFEPEPPSWELFGSPSSRASPRSVV